MNPFHFPAGWRIPGIDWKRLGLACAGGVLCALAFPNPLDIHLSWRGGFLAWVGLIPLFYLAAETWWQALRWGFVFGLVYFGISISWMAFMPALGPLAPGVWLLLTAYLAVFPALFVGLSQFLTRRGIPCWSAAPALWVSLEYLRNHALSGFPWAILGAAQYTNPWVLSLAPFSGVWGLSWVTVLGNVLLFAALQPRNGQNRTPDAAVPGGRRIHLLVAAAMALAVVGGGAWEHGRLARIPDKSVATVAALQGNIDQNQPWDEAYRRSTLDRFLDLGTQARAQKAELLIWPESSFPGVFNWDQALANEVRSWSRAWQVDQIVSSDTVGLGGPSREYQYFNTMIWVDPHGTVTGRFSKIHLVPFGEYIPFKHTLLFFLRKMVPRYENGEFTPGEQRLPLVWNRPQGASRVGGLICFESIFPQYAAQLVRRGSELLVVVTYDAWFGKTAAPAQHAVFSALRAVETDRYIIHNAATGISCAFDPRGRLLGLVPLNTPGALVVQAGLRTTQTFFVHWGPWLPWWCIIWILLLFVGAYCNTPLRLNIKKMFEPKKNHHKNIPSPQEDLK